MDPGRGKLKTGYFWAFARDDRPWAGEVPPGVAFTYASGRGGKYALFAGHEAGVQNWAMLASLIETCKLIALGILWVRCQQGTACYFIEKLEAE